MASQVINRSVVEKIQKLEKKAIDNLSNPANKHGISLISSIAFLTLAMISSILAFPSIVIYSSFSICISSLLY